MNSSQFDIIIVGGGMVGAAMAQALRDHQFNIALIDATPLTPREDHRLIALNYRSVNFLKSLNLWPALQDHAASIRTVHVSHRGHFGTTRLQAADVNLPELGHVVPAKYIESALYQSLEHIKLIRPATLKTLTHIDHPTLTLTTPQGEKTLSAKVIIGADGTHSTLRDLLAIPTEKKDYHQSALVTVTELSRSHHHVAYERFQEQGAIAMLPLTGHRVATIWTASDATISRLKNLSDQDFLAELQQNFGYRLGRFKGIAQRYSYPLQHIQAKSKVCQQVILIGNAAHTLHPIAAQGLNLALFEIAELARYFKQHSLEKLSLTDFATTQQKISTRLSHQLASLFATDFFIANTARQLGMLGLDLIPALKKRFIRGAIGLSS